MEFAIFKGAVFIDSTALVHSYDCHLHVAFLLESTVPMELLNISIAMRSLGYDYVPVQNV